MRPTSRRDLLLAAGTLPVRVMDMYEHYCQMDYGAAAQASAQTHFCFQAPEASW
jgi:hypothetical protein